jgi:hypothetical protein
MKYWCQLLLNFVEVGSLEDHGFKQATKTDMQTEHRYGVVSITPFLHIVHGRFNKESVKEL